MGALGGRDLLGCPGDHQLAPLVARLRADIDDPVGRLDHIQIVLDHHDAVPFGDKAVEGFQQDGDIVDMKARSRFVKDQEGAPRFMTRKASGELQALGFPSAQDI